MVNLHDVPYISFIICGRNDDHGGNFLERLNTFLSTIDRFSNQYQLLCEVLLVEWNPPLNKPFLDQVICAPTNNSFMLLSVIRIPHDIHVKVAGNFPFPLLEWQAKNAGAFRSRGEFILITNPDNIISEELFQILSRKTLKKKYFYRAIRKDTTPISKTHAFNNQEIQKFCKANILRFHGLYGQEELYPHTKKKKFKVLFSREIRRFLKIVLPNYKLFTNAAGDFLLTHRDNFIKMRGYPEIKKHSFIDGYACYMLYNQGLKEKIFHERECMYHQDHGRPSKKGLIHYRIEILRILKKRIITLNKENSWGLQKFYLSQYPCCCK